MTTSGKTQTCNKSTILQPTLVARTQNSSHGMLLLGHLKPFEDKCATFSWGRKQHRHIITPVTGAKAALTWNHRVFFLIVLTNFFCACFGHVPLSLEAEYANFWAVTGAKATPTWRHVWAMSLCHLKPNMRLLVGGESCTDSPSFA